MKLFLINFHLLRNCLNSHFFTFLAKHLWTYKFNTVQRILSRKKKRKEKKICVDTFLTERVEICVDTCTFIHIASLDWNPIKSLLKSANYHSFLLHAKFCQLVSSHHLRSSLSALLCTDCRIDSSLSLSIQ